MIILRIFMTLVEHLFSRRLSFLCMMVVFLVAFMLNLSIAQFSLPYVDHPDEPASYLKAQEWRGLFDLEGFHDGYPPAFLALHWLVQSATQAEGPLDLAPTIGILRTLSAVVSALTAVLVGLAARVLMAPLHRDGQAAALLLGGLIWATSPIIFPETVLALPDPYVYALAALCAWASLHALVRQHGMRWLLAGWIAALLAVLFKYSAAPLLVVPSVIWLGLFATRRADRSFLGRMLVIMITLAVIAALFLLVYGAQNLNTPGTSDVARESGFSNLLNLTLITANFRLMLTPFNIVTTAFAGLTLLYLLVLRGPAAQQQNLWRIGGLALLGGIVAIPWAASAFSTLEGLGIRFVMPGTVLVCIVVATGLGILVAFARTLGGSVLAATALGAALILWVLPSGPALTAIVQDRRLPDSRVPLRTWVDLNMPGGVVMVSDANHKTFNPIWGGIPYRTWTDWIVSETASDYENRALLDELGVTLIASSDPAHVPPADGIYIGTFGGENWRGPVTDLYRVSPLDVMYSYHFGPISLVGYDIDAVPARGGEQLTLKFMWSARAGGVQDLSQFLHLTQTEDVIPLAQADGPPCGNEQQTSRWPANLRCFGMFSLEIPQSLDAGDYLLRLGLYDSISGSRLTAQTHDSITIARLIIAEDGTLTYTPA
jgi:hypothetical protein